jgi:hypothetical protein
MTDHVGRLYAVALSILVFFLVWAAVAARPWSAPAAAKADPRVIALQRRELRLRHETVAVQRIVARRWHVYRIQLRQREKAIAAARERHLAQLRVAARAHAAAVAAAAAAAAAAASAPVAAAPAAAPSYAAPAVRVVTLPPITITRSS